MIRNGYIQCQANHTLFVKHQDTGLTALIVYVDDIVMKENNDIFFKDNKENLSTDWRRNFRSRI